MLGPKPVGETASNGGEVVLKVSAGAAAWQQLLGGSWALRRLTDGLVPALERWPVVCICPLPWKASVSKNMYRRRQVRP